MAKVLPLSESVTPSAGSMSDNDPAPFSAVADTMTGDIKVAEDTIPPESLPCTVASAAGGVLTGIVTGIVVGSGWLVSSGTHAVINRVRKTIKVDSKGFIRSLLLITIYY